MAEGLAALAGGIILSGGILYALYPMPAYPHEATNTAGQPLGWKYPWACCSNLDCRAVTGGTPQSDIRETPGGYKVQITGEVLAYTDKRIKDSPDGSWHWCAHQAGADAGHTICLFVPPKGF